MKIFLLFVAEIRLDTFWIVIILNFGHIYTKYNKIHFSLEIFYNICLSIRLTFKSLKFTKINNEGMVMSKMHALECFDVSEHLKCS